MRAAPSLEALAAADLKLPVLQLGLPDRFVDHGDTTLLQKECGLDPAGIAAAIRQRFGSILLHPTRSVA